MKDLYFTTRNVGGYASRGPALERLAETISSISHRSRWTAFFVILLLFISGASWGQAATYNYASSSGTYAEISGGTVVSTTTWDSNVSSLITIPSFVFNGTTVTTMTISSNGWISIGGSAASTSTFTTNSLTGSVTATGAAGVICPFGADLSNSASSEVRWEYLSGSNETVIQWKGVQLWSSLGNGSNLNFQIRLNHTTNTIRFVYGTMTRGTATSNPQVGIKSGVAAGVLGTTMLALTLKNIPTGTTCLNWSDAVRGSSTTAGNTSMLFTSAAPVSTLSSGTTFTFTPQSGLSSTWVNPVTTYTANTGWSISATGATPSWTAPTNANRYNVQYRRAADCAWTDFSGNPVSSASAALTGLQPFTTYHVRVQPFNNGSNNTAGYSHISSGTATANADGYVAAGSFTTLALMPTISAISPTNACPGSTITITGTNLTGATAADVKVGGTAVASITSNDGTTLVAVLGTATTGTVSVTIGGNTATSTSTFTFDAAPAAPTAPSTTGLLASGFTANWTASAGGGGFTGYLLDVSTSSTYASFVSGYNGLSIGDVTTYNVTGLSANTTYYWRVRATGNCVSPNAASQTVYTGHCIPTSNCGAGDVIASIQLNTLSNTTGTACAAGGYSDFTGNNTLTTTLLPTQSYVVTVGVASYAQSIAVWIDYNDDLVFDNVTERVGATLAGSPVPVNGTASFTITLGCNPPAGAHRMRVRSSDNSFVTGPNQTPCATYSWGETEDYRITIAPAPACPSSGALTATPTSLTSANLAWTMGCSTASNFDFEYGPAGFAPGSGTLLSDVAATVTGGNGAYTLTGLTPNTAYQVYYRANCGGGNYASWFGPVSFATQHCTPTGNTTYYVTGVSTTGAWSNISNTSAAGTGGYTNNYATQAVLNTEGSTPTSITITSSSGGDLFFCWIDWNNDLDFDDAGESIFASTTYGGSYTGTIVIPAGTALGDYRMRVANSWSGNVTACGPGSYAEYEDYKFSVVPAPTCLTPTNVAASPTSTTSANLSWSAPASGDAPSGYVWELLSGTTLVASGTTTAPTTSATASGLTANTNYTLRVKTDCSAASTVSFWATASMFTGYCSPSGSSVDGQGITNVTFGTGPVVNNTTTAETNNYGNYSAQNGGLALGLTASVNITYSTGYTYGTYIWVDWNNDLDFNDAGENVYTGESLSSNPTTLVATFTVPSTATVGATHRMRIGGSDGAPNTPLTPCTTGSSFTTYEDYTITILAPPPVATVTLSPDCGNNQYSYVVNVTSTGLAGQLVNITSDNGNPNAQMGVGIGSYVIGPFTSGSTPVITVANAADAALVATLSYPSYDCAWAGKNALDFDGVNDRVNCGTAAPITITGNALTLEAWIYPTAFTTETWRGNIINREDPITATGYMLRCGGNGVLNFHFGNGSVWSFVESPANALVLNQWQHVAGVYDGSTVKLYINGTQVATASSTLTIANPASYGLTIGNQSADDTRGFKGKIDEVRIWNVARSAANISTYMTQQLEGCETGLKVYYTFDQGAEYQNNAAVTTLTDASVSGVNGTLANMALAGVNSNWVTGKQGISPAAPAPCSGTPAPGATQTSANTVILGESVLLTLQNPTCGTGLIYTWESSSDNVTWNPIAGANASSYSASPTASTWYRCKVSCGANEGIATAIQITVRIPYNVAYTETGVAYTSIMPNNGGTGTAYAGWSGTSGDDNTTNAVSLTGTTFTYLGQPVTGFKACTNGWMTLNTTVTSTSFTNNITATATNTLLAPFWDDLVLTGNDWANNKDNCMRYQIDGTLGSGSAVITVEWAGIERFSIPGPNLNFQVKLYEAGNVIEFIYGNFEAFDGTAISAYSYTIGYNGATPNGNTRMDRACMQTAMSNHWMSDANASLSYLPTCNSKFTLTPGAYTGPTSAPVFPAPVNDNVNNATALTVNQAPCTSLCGTYYSTRNATSSGVASSACAGTTDADDDVWFSFVAASSVASATQNHQIKVRAIGGFGAVVQLFDNAMTSIACSNAVTTVAGETETIAANNLTVGNTYYVRVFNAGAGSGGQQFSICVNEEILPPANDEIAGAVALTPNSCVPQSSPLPNVLVATNSNGIGGVPTVTTGTPDDDVWYSFVAASTSDVVTVQSGAGYNAVVQILSSSNNTPTGVLTSMAVYNSTSTAGVENSTLTTLTVGNTYFVRVYHNANGPGSGNFNISVNSQCSAPTALSATGSQTGATITWTAPAGTSNFEYFYNATGTAPGSNTAAMGSVTGSTLTLTGLTSFTTYSVWVRSACSACTKSAWQLVTVFTDTYCLPSVTFGCTDGDVIAQVQIAKLDGTVLLNNVSGAGCPGGTSGYSNYVADPAFSGSNIAVMNAGGTYNCLVFAGQWSEDYAAWIDFNEDGVFDDATEKIGYTTAAVAGSGVVGEVGGSTTFAIGLPCNAPTGIKRMRVRCVYGVISGADITPCGIASYGEIEDYVVSIGAQIPFTPTFTASANNAECSGISINYTTQAGYSNYTWSITDGNNVALTEGVDYTLQTSGPLTTSNSIGIAYITAGQRKVSVNYSTPIYNCPSTGAVTDVTTVTLQTVPGSLVFTANATNTGGTIVYDATLAQGSVLGWQRSTDNGTTWQAMSPNGPSSFTYVNLSVTTLYRVLVANGSCTTLPTNVITGNVAGAGVANAVSINYIGQFGTGVQTSYSANLSTIANNEVWYLFTPTSNAVRIAVTGATGVADDNEIRLYEGVASANMIPITVENNVSIAAAGASSSEPGNEVLLTDELTPNTPYYFSVKNNNGTAGTVNIVISNLRSSESDILLYTNNTSTYSNTCQNFKAKFRANATGYNVKRWASQAAAQSAAATATGTPVWSYSIPPGTGTVASTVCQLGKILPPNINGPSVNYYLTIDVSYNLANAYGTMIPLTAIGNVVSQVGLNQEADLNVRVSDRCPIAKLASSGSIATNRSVCGVRNYDYNFVMTAPSPAAFDNFVSGPVGGSRILALSTVPGIGNGQTYNVTIRTKHVDNLSLSNFGTVACVKTAGVAGMPTIEDEGVIAERSFNGVVTSIYPNPNNGSSVNLNVDGLDGELQVRITDATGRKVYSNRYIVDGVMNTTMDFGQTLAGGMYLVEMVQNGQMSTMRMVVNR